MHRKYVGFMAGGVAVALAANSALAQFLPASPNTVYTAGTVNSFGSPAPATATTPSAQNDAASNTSLTEGESFANFGPLVLAAYNADTGGVINFEEADENGNFNTGTTSPNNVSPTFSWPSQSTSTTNGLTVGNIPNIASVNTTTAAAPNAVQINYGFDQPTGTQAYSNTGASNTTQLVAGTNSIKLWRDQYQFTTDPNNANGNLAVPIGSTRNVPIGFKATTLGTTNQANANDGYDANNGENNSSVANFGTFPTSGNSYAGITNDGTPAVLDFSSNPLSAFGIEAVGRNANPARPLTVHLTLADGFVISSSNEANTGAGTAATFFGFNLTATDLSTHGGIIYATLDSTSVDRYDDLAFIVAPTPEPASLGLLGLGGVAMMRRRRKA